MIHNNDKLKEFGKKYPRVGGLLLILFGSAGFYWGIYRAYLDALQHAESIQFYMSMPTLATLFLIFGAVVLIFGKAPKILCVECPSKSTKIILFILIFASWIICSAPYCALVGRIEAMGYQIKSNLIYDLYTHVPLLNALAHFADKLFS